MKKQNKTTSPVKSSSISVLVEEYTDQLMKKKRANPQQFLERFSSSARKEEFKRHMNVATFLTMQGLAMQARLAKTGKNRKKVEKSRQLLFKKLVKNKGGIR